MPSNKEVMQRLSNIAQNDIFSVVSGTGPYATDIPQLCITIVEIIEQFLDPATSIDLSEPSILNFLKHTLPALTEALFRRTTFREHEDAVARLLISVSRLLAKPASHDIVELCELRNLLLVGIIPQQLKFIEVKQLTNNQNLGTYFTNDGFYGEYGAPSVAYFGSKTTTFWPDEWQKTLGGVKAVGHFVQWYQRGEEGDAERSGWLVGRVASYKSESKEHIIQLEADSSSSDSDNSSVEQIKAPAASSVESASAAVAEPVFVAVVLSKVKHQWIDADFRARLAQHPQHPVGQSSSAAAPLGDALLDYSHTDVGQFIRIWWSRYSKYYYGRVVRYDPVSKQHTISYEDNDTRSYAMQTKDYMVIVPPTEVLHTADGSHLTDTQAAKLVADWYRSVEAAQHSADLAAGKDNTKLDGETVPYVFAYVHRPVAATALTLSLFQLAVIDEYFKEGGAESMFQSLTDASQAAPVGRIILLHLQMVYQLRNYIGTEKFNELAWDLKEAIPFALFRYEDAQIKDLTSKTLNDILAALKDTLLVAVNGTQYSTNHNIRENIDEMRLTIASMLLVCSQLQKRYLGLSMIKDMLDTLLPLLDNYVTKRYNSLGIARTTRPPGTRPPVGPNPPRITPAFVDKWLVDNGVLEVLFGESLHQDLAAKSDVLLLYMGSRKVLTEKHIDLIWNASLGVHEAVVRVLHQLLVLIVPVLGPTLRNYLFSLMSALPCKDYTEQILQLIKTYTEQALIASKVDTNTNNSSSAVAEINPIAGLGGNNRKGQVLNVSQRQWMGFGVLWQFVQDPSVSSATDSVDEGLVDLAVQLLVELLQEEFKEERELVMQRCLDNIQAGRSVPVSLQILRRTLALYPQAPKSWFVLGRPNVGKTTTVAHQIEKLIRNSQLLDILFRDLDAYHRSILASEKNETAAVINLGLKPSRSLLGIDKIVPKLMMRGSAAAPAPTAGTTNGSAGKALVNATGRVSQLKGVSERLDFLRFIISWSSVKLSEQQTMILWNAFGEGATTAETLEKLFLWFNVLVNKESKPLAALLSSVSQESDPTDPDQRSKLAFLAPQLAALIQQQGYNFPSSGSTNIALALLAGGNEEDDTITSALGAAGADSHSTFDEGVLIKLFEENIVKWAFRIDKVDTLSRLPVANLCFKLFLHTNICNKSLKVEPDGSWVRVGPLSGLPLLWRIALDSTDLGVAHAAIALIIELHHKSGGLQQKSSSRASEPGFKADLLQLCFKHLYLAMNSLQLEDGSSPSVTPPPPEVDTGNTAHRRGIIGHNNHSQQNHGAQQVESSSAQDEWFHDHDALMKPAVIAARIERLIVTLRLAIHRYYMAPTVLHTIKVLVGREETPVFTVVLKATDLVGQLRRKVAEHFKESVESIQLLKTGKVVSSLMGMSTTPQQEVLDRDELTLVQAKLAVQDSITARKNDAPGGEIGTPAGSIQSQKNTSRADVKDLFTPRDLSVNLLKPLSPLQWLNACVPTGSEDAAPSNCGNNSVEIVGGVSTPYELFVLPPFPLVSVIESKLIAAQEGVASHVPALIEEGKGSTGAAKDSTAAPARVPTVAAERFNKVQDYLTPLFLSAPHYIDQLLEILDGYLSTDTVDPPGRSSSSSSSGNNSNSSGSAPSTDLSAAVWDILLSLPPHGPISMQLRGMVRAADSSVMNHLLSPSCPYRLLYNLRIIDTFLSLGSASNAFPTATAASAAVLDWTVKFFHIGGAENILQLLDHFLTKECQREVKSTQFGKQGGCGRNLSCEGMPRKDLNVMIVSILSRVLYHLLMLDPLFRSWQSSSASEIQSRLYATYEELGGDGQSSSDIVPAGVILSNVDVRATCTHILRCSLHAAELYSARMITSSALRALCENAFLLMFGLLSSVNDAFEIISESDLFRSWLSALCVRCGNKLVRQAACRRLFEVSANIFNKCADPTVSQEHKRTRLRFYDFIHAEIVASVGLETANRDLDNAISILKPASQPQGIQIKNGEEVYTLIAVIEALRNSPYLIFPQISSRRVMQSSSGKIVDMSSPRSLVASPNDSVRSSPRNVDVNSPDEDPAGTAALIRLFIAKLMTHVSNESFHSPEPDGTLVGILRVLLVFANSNNDQRIAMGDMCVQLDDGSSDRLIPYIYTNCLFPTLGPAGANVGDVSPTASSNYVEFLGTVEASCQTQESRKLAYALLYRLCESTASNLTQLVEAIGGEVLSSGTAVVAPKSTAMTEASEYDPSAAMKRIPTWNYDPDALVKEPDAFVGLCNQGGTCYMNSFVQQLFHIPGFKAGLLRINAAGKGKGVNPDEALDANAQLLFQLQVMFGFMTFSQKRYYDTLPFCRAFIDYDGEPISLSEQKDINEFAGMLFDKLEANKEAAALLANTIQGKIVWRTRSIETPYKSEREENFYMLTAEVKDKATLEDSLELFTAEELFSGDNKIEDSDTGRKVDALRGCALRSLPSTLIIHLKRFEFDLETMNRKKVNDLISFPTDLNMFPYTEEGLQAKEDKVRTNGSSPVPTEGSAEDLADHEDEGAQSAATSSVPATVTATASRKPDGYYQYALKGVVAHVGAIDRGHYYSFIKDMDSGGAGGSGSGTWHEFNDRSVLPFSPEAIPVECFGGKEEYVNSSGATVSRARENSAYILVYERVDRTAHEELYETSRRRFNSEPIEEIMSGGVSGGIRGVRSGSIDETHPRRGVSKKVMRAVSTENAEFQRDRFLFHPLHFAFIWQLQQMQSVVDLLQSAKAKLPVLEQDEKRYIYDSADPEDVQLTLTVPTAADEEKNSVENALSHLVLDGMRFIVEVLVRARAKSCVQVFLERLEEIVLQDVSGASAKFLIEFLTSTDESPLVVAPPSADSSVTSAAHPDFVDVPSHGSAKTKVQMDLESVERACHPWLAQMLVFCPHPGSSRLFLRFLLACIKVVRAAQQAPGFVAEAADLTEVSSGTDSSGPQVVLSIPACVASLVDKVVLLTERPQLDYMGCKENYELRCMFLLQYASLGPDEKALLVHLGAIPRLSCSIMAQYPTVSKTGDVKLHICIDVITKLVRASRSVRQLTGSVVSSASSTADSLEAGGEEPPVKIPIFLKPIDMQAFLGRTFLEEAISIHPVATAAALRHLYRMMSPEEAVLLVDFITERLTDQLAGSSGAQPAYRPFWRVLSDLLLGVALADVLLHVGALIKITSKLQHMAGRQAGLDAEYLFGALRLLHSLGASSLEAHGTVMQLRDQWKHVAAKLAAAKRTAVYSADGIQQAPAGQSSGKGSAPGNVFSKATSTASAFIMN